ncbi:hypothetical protein PHYBLDRAFT_71623 [Phycomyces blakesleeanus NRRL 1555(-)]|uniref:Uncharacterized protein n=1 Tax=Phycomyces blakesleeanus (strain ATCC 8743b / DSM 1359 / FGSC 10004 / NBRC 33097 / NRRL 1555) TaxID=763407 RepID=A0A167JEY7_PHYB8|nr:hypothetical protein PHYBLDRAFT_71623 [Phycomyces blakesleeanus NRRL 1555(-)]OAD65859.1 hypothetical protein PHYBLDRAFT_71623 [Phycomyces blakesleeanus NRRL 1555(-)]|eukprot:XP_018283899.1 hypothetical protein PHYBLDRAFT_71623 [Phycomyces blakesleeanus NRRL 1555(-)]
MFFFYFDTRLGYGVTGDFYIFQVSDMKGRNSTRQLDHWTSGPLVYTTNLIFQPSCQSWILTGSVLNISNKLTRAAIYIQSAYIHHMIVLNATEDYEEINEGYQRRIAKKASICIGLSDNQPTLQR